MFIRCVGGFLIFTGGGMTSVATHSSNIVLFTIAFVITTAGVYSIVRE